MPKISEIVWRDAEDSDGTWHSEDEIKDFSEDDCLVHSFGVILKKTKKYITLAGDVIEGKDKTYGRVTKIPTGMIVKIK